MLTDEDVKVRAKQILRDVIKEVESEEERCLLKKHGATTMADVADYVEFQQELNRAVEERIAGLEGALVTLALKGLKISERGPLAPIA